MANFETYHQYQRIEDLEEESPAGEEDLLLHVPEGLKGKRVSTALSFQIVFSPREMGLKKNIWILEQSLTNKEFPFCYRLMAPYQEPG